MHTQYLYSNNNGMTSNSGAQHPTVSKKQLPFNIRLKINIVFAKMETEEYSIIYGVMLVVMQAGLFTTCGWSNEEKGLQNYALFAIALLFLVSSIVLLVIFHGVYAKYRIV